MTDNISQVLLYLAGIQSPHYRDEYNVLSDGYNARRERIIKNTVNYDELREDHEKELKEKEELEKKEKIKEQQKKKKKKRR